MSHHLSTLGRRLRRLREARSLTQTALAQAAGTTQAAVANVEHGYAKPSLSLADRLAAALDVTLDELVRGAGTDDEPQPS